MKAAIPMNPDDYNKFGLAMGARLVEHFDGLCIIGFHAQTGQPVIYVNAGDIKTRLALTELLRGALMNNAVTHAQNPLPAPPNEPASGTG